MERHLELDEHLFRREAGRMVAALTRIFGVHNLALMCLHAARLPARIDAAGDLSPLLEQDRSRWDARLIAQGLAHLERSAAGDEVTAYHIEAAIAAVHASAPSVDETDWASIVSLYDRLMSIASSPVVALNRAIATAQRDGAGALLGGARPRP